MTAKLSVYDANFFQRKGIARVVVELQLGSRLSSRMYNMLARCIKTGFLSAGDWSTTGRVMSLLADEVDLPWCSCGRYLRSQDVSAYLHFHRVEAIPPDIMQRLRDEILAADKSLAQVLGKRIDEKSWRASYYRSDKGFYALYALKGEDHIRGLLHPMITSNDYQSKAARAMRILKGEEVPVIHI